MEAVQVLAAFLKFSMLSLTKKNIIKLAPKSILKSQFNNNKKVLDKESVDSKVLDHENKPNSEIEPFIAVKRDNIEHSRILPPAVL